MIKSSVLYNQYRIIVILQNLKDTRKINKLCESTQQKTF